MPRTASKDSLGPTVPVRFHPEVRKDIRHASKAIRLSEADTIRKATEMGLPLLLSALGADPKKAA
jgi:hypothetical protein